MATEVIRTRKEILTDIRSDADARQPQALVADVLMRILEVLLDIRADLVRKS